MAIPTIYRGVEYRSRLEARWAAFFDHVGWQHTYEPFDGDGYIPDFLVHGDFPFLVEVKPAVTLTQYQAPIPKITAGLRDAWSGRVLIVGADPLPASIPNGYPGTRALGLLDEEQDDDQPRSEGWWCAALVSLGHCGQVGFCHEYQSYKHSPCGCYDGNNSGFIDAKPWIDSAWAAATNDVKWRGRDAA